MENTLITSVAGVRFTKVGKIYHFDSRNVTDLVVGDQVVVETSRGWQLGSVAQVVEKMPVPEGMKMIDRRATPRDLLLRQSWQSREEEVLEAGRKRARDLGLVGIKLVSAEYSFDGTRLTMMFSSESEEKYDLKSLRQDMQRAYAPSQVEMRQIGPRDVAKMMGGMGACGKETRCCSEFLCEFSSISIRMAKEQGISLTPSEITGMCGRLRCCLIYEYDQYTEARALLPKRNKRVMTPQGEGRVLDQVPIRDAVIVQLMDDTRREFLRSEIQVLDESGAPIPAPRLEMDEETEGGEAANGSNEPPALPPAGDRRPSADASGQYPPGQQHPRPDRRGGPHERRSQDQQRRPMGQSQQSSQGSNRPPQNRQQGDSGPNPQGRNQPRHPRTDRPPRSNQTDQANNQVSPGPQHPQQPRQHQPGGRPGRPNHPGPEPRRRQDSEGKPNGGDGPADEE